MKGTRLIYFIFHQFTYSHASSKLKIHRESIKASVKNLKVNFLGIKVLRHFIGCINEVIRLILQLVRSLHMESAQCYSQSSKYFH